MQSTVIDSGNLFPLLHFFDVLRPWCSPCPERGRVAQRHGRDGIHVACAITGVGGGTVRDLILDLPAFWVQSPVYVSACLVTAFVMHFVAPLVESRYKTLLWFDAFGLALVTVAGTVKSLDAVRPRWSRSRGRGHRLPWRNHP